MRKSLKIYIWSWVVIIAITICGSIVLSVISGNGTEHHNHLIKLSESPEYIENVIKVDLPDIAHLESDYGAGSSWTTYSYELKFNEALSEDCIEELNKLCETDSVHWSKNFNGDFIYHESENLDYEIFSIIYNDHSVVDYGIYDELPSSVLGFLASTTAVLYILIIWGVVLLIIAVVRKMISKNKN